jgi:polar amino acid transport system permease protein
MTFNFGFAWHILPMLAKAAEITVFVTVVSFALSLVGGLLIWWLRTSKIALVSRVTSGFSDFIRGTPLLLQVFLIYYVGPRYGLVLSPIQTGLIALGIHYSCYMSEVYRSAFGAVNRGQQEAARALGLSPWRTFQKVILPQMYPVVVPIAGSYLVYMFKDTPILSAITVRELMQVASQIGSTNFRYMEPITIVGILFLAMSLLAAWASRVIERKIAVP